MGRADHLYLELYFGGFAFAVAGVVAFTTLHYFFEVHDIASLIIPFILLLRRFLHTILKLVKLNKEYNMLEISRMHDPTV